MIHSYYAGPVVEDELKPIVDEYLERCGTTQYYPMIRSIQITTVRSKEAPNRVGLCTGDIWENGRIHYLNVYVEDLSEFPWAMKALVFHEMGHCAQRLDHVDDPNSLMYPSLILTEVEYETRWEELTANLCEADDVYNLHRVSASKTNQE
jgi:hypothetical protein